MPSKSSQIAIAVLAIFSAATYAAELNEIRSTLGDQQSVAVTIYNNNLALVKDQRKVKLNSGLNSLALRDVSAQMRPETALLRSLSHSGSLNTLEQDFDFDLLTPQKLLEKYVGKTVSIIKTNPATGLETTEQATVLSANNGTVLKIGNRIETGLPANTSRIVYGDVPENLRDRPTLVTKLNSKTSAEQMVELSYLTGGLGWKADYVAELNAKEDSLDLSGWVTLTNTSGATYSNAKLQLVAGNVNLINSNVHTKQIAYGATDALGASPAPMKAESLFEYHLYTLDHPTTIAENQTKQVALLSAFGIPARKELVLRGASHYYSSSYSNLGQKLKVSTFIEFDNKEASKLGIPIPKGVIRAYKKDNLENAQFIGEDNIEHVAKNETVRFKAGESFDVTATKKQTDFKFLQNPVDQSNRVKTRTYESAYEVVLKNAKKERISITVEEPIPGDWQMLFLSHPNQKASSNTAVWKIEIPAEGKTTLSYRVQVKY